MEILDTLIQALQAARDAATAEHGHINLPSAVYLTVRRFVMRLPFRARMWLRRHRRRALIHAYVSH